MRAFALDLISPTLSARPTSLLLPPHDVYSRYGPMQRTKYRLTVENLSTRVSWQVSIDDSSFFYDRLGHSENTIVVCYALFVCLTLMLVPLMNDYDGIDG